MSTSETAVCTRCTSEPRSKGSSWGKACLAAARKASRNATPDATSDATPRADATRRATCANCESLAGEVSSLKRRLKEANEKLEALGRAPAPAGEDLDRTERHLEARRAVTDYASSQNASKATVTPHGPRCQNVCCRSARAMAAAEAGA